VGVRIFTLIKAITVREKNLVIAKCTIIVLGFSI